jgi:hypothetical protein
MSVSRYLPKLRRRRVLIIGDSHTVALQGAVSKRRFSPVAFEAHRFQRVKAAGHEFVGVEVEDVPPMLAAMTPMDLVAVVLDGSFHARIGIFQHPQRYDFSVGGEPIPPAIWTVPKRQIVDLIDKDLKKRVRPRLGMIKKHARCPIVHLSYPPPKDDVGFLKSNLGPLYGRVEEFGLADPSFVQKLWAASLERLKALCEEFGIELLPTPAASLNANGFLRRDLYAPDTVHANAQYGRIVLDQICAWVKQR